MLGKLVYKVTSTFISSLPKLSKARLLRHIGIHYVSFTFTVVTVSLLSGLVVMNE